MEEHKKRLQTLLLGSENFELIAKLASIQKPDGSFAGEKKWMEDSPIIATSMATLAIETAVADLEKK